MAVSAIPGYITCLLPKRPTSHAVMPVDMPAMPSAWGRKARPVLTGL